MRWLLLVLLSIGCRQFDPPSSGATDPCSQVEAVFAVNGIPLDNRGLTPVTTVLVGDTVTLSAQGSCVPSGPIGYEWIIRSDNANDNNTVLPDSTSETITLYPTRAGSYDVELVLSDNGIEVADVSAAAFEAAGWIALDNFPRLLDGKGDIRDLAASADTLWVSASLGAYRVPLDDPELPEAYVEINDDTTGTELPDDVRAVHYELATNRVWYSNDREDTNLYHLQATTGAAAVSVVELAPTTTKVTDIAPLDGGGVIAAGDLGIYSSVDGATFQTESNANSEAVASTPGKRWAGNSALTDLGPTDDSLDDIVYDVFNGDGRIKEIIVVGNELWIASDDLGVARVDPAAPLTDPILYTAPSDLPSSGARDLAVDSLGDVWAATKEGVARYKADRGVWVILDQNVVGFGRDRLDAIAIDESNGRRAVYVGGFSAGLTYTHVPSP